MSHEVICKLYDLETNELADISEIALERKLSRRLSQARGFTIQAPAGHSLLTTVAGDGHPNLRMGNRKLLVWEDDAIIFHGRVDSVERNGDGNRNLVTINAFDPVLTDFGYSGDERAGRPVRDASGNFVNPTFVSNAGGGQEEISGPDLIYQSLVNSQQEGGETDPTPGEGPLPIHLDIDNFDLDVPPAIDLTPNAKMDWPVLLGDFVQLLVHTGVVDVDARPIDPAEALDAYAMVEIFARSSQGTDRSATVHFDYWTGSKNASAARHVSSFKEVCNKLYDYLGPRLNRSHWRANITPGSPGVTVDPTASRDLFGGPDSGQMMQIRVHDSFGGESTARPLYLALFNAELGYRVMGRDLLFITPAPDSAALFEPPADFDVGDIIAVNTGAAFGVALAEDQRVYGYDRSWDRNGVARVSELTTSADPA